MKVPLVEKRKNLLPYLAPLALAALLGACGKAPQTAAAPSGQPHPDHDTIATFRRRFLPQVKSLFHFKLLHDPLSGAFSLASATALTT